MESSNSQVCFLISLTMDTLNKKHGGNYTVMQYRIWSEMCMHTELDNPPSNSMFKKAGPATPSTKKKHKQFLLQLLLHALLKQMQLAPQPALVQLKLLKIALGVTNN